MAAGTRTGDRTIRMTRKGAYAVMISPMFLRFAELSGWVVVLGDSNRGTESVSAGLLTLKRNLAPPPRRDDVSNRPTCAVALSPGDKVVVAGPVTARFGP